MKGLGASQTWVSTSSAEDPVENYLHGNIRNRKVVLNEALLQRGEITPVTQGVPNRKINRSSSPPASLWSWRWPYLRRRAREGILRIGDVRSVVGDDIVLTVMSTACFSGGRFASTSLNDARVVSESWNESPSVCRRNCGSIYVSALINALSDASSPLVESPNENSSITGSIQTESFNEFARSIYDTPGIPFRTFAHRWDRLSI